MAKKKSDKKHIFCLETDQWYGQKNRSSVEPMLQVVERHQDVSYQHRDVATSGEFEFFLSKYLNPGYQNYPILYLGFHGWKGDDESDSYVTLGDGTNVTLKELENLIAGKCRGRFVYFGACGVMDAHGARLNSFVKNTGAVAVAGYREEVPWLESTAFDMLVLGGLQARAFTKPSISKFDKDLKNTAPGLYKDLGFRLIVKT